MIAKIVKVNIKNVEDGIAVGSIVLEDSTSYTIFGEESKLKEYEGITANINFRTDIVNGIKTKVVSFISAASLGAAIVNNTESFSTLVNSANRGSSYLNFDPRSVNTVYPDATFMILDAIDKNENWSDLTCIGCTTKFTLRWFHHGIKNDIKLYIGKIAMTDISKNSYGFSTSKEIQVLDIKLFDNADVTRAIEFISKSIAQYTQLMEYVNKIGYFSLLNKQDTAHVLVKAALQIEYAQKISNHFTGTNLNTIISSIIIRSLRILVKQIDVNPDLALYTKLYTPHWNGQNLTMYILSDSNVYRTDLDRYIINLSEEIVNKIYTGGTIECAK